MPATVSRATYFVVVSMVVAVVSVITAGAVTFALLIAVAFVGCVIALSFRHLGETFSPFA